MSTDEVALRKAVISMIANAPRPMTELNDIRGLCGSDYMSLLALLDRMVIEDTLDRSEVAGKIWYQIVPERRNELLSSAVDTEALPADPEPVSRPEPDPVPVPARVEATHQPPRVHGRIESIGDAIFQLLGARGHLTGPTIMQALNVPQPILSKAILSLEAKGLITRSGPKFRPVYSAAPVNATRSGDTAAAPLALEQKVLDDTLKFHQERAEIEAKRRGRTPPIEPESKAITVDAQTAVFALRSDLRLAIDTGDVSIVLSPECTVQLANYLDHTCSLVLPARAPMTEKH